MLTAFHKLSSVRLALLVFFWMAMLMSVFEIGKTALLGPSQTLWQSHLITIVVSAAFAAAASVVVRDLAQRSHRLDLLAAQRQAELESTQQSLFHFKEELTRSEAKAMLSTLVASVSHELNAPVGNSLLAAGTLSANVEQFKKIADSGQFKRTELMSFLENEREGSTILLRNLQRVDELLQKFKQVSADQASERRRQFDLGEAIAEILGTMVPSLKTKTHRVVLQIPQGIRMDSYPGPIGQIIINLVNNAYTHAFENTVQGTLTISAEAAENWVKLTVEDDGVGIPEQNVPQLFDQFFSTTIGKGGTGLGLAIVRNLVVKTMGGTIDVYSVVGQGTRFVIHLPSVSPGK
jgi:signal transduction histidine kinase